MVQHTTYVDAGASAIDDTTESVKVSVVGDINTSHVGDFNITYVAKDKAGNIAKATRKVVVIEDINLTHNGTVYGIVASPYTGKVWLDRNLGARHVCTTSNDVLCYGDYYQWGRNYDGHQDMYSSQTTIQATDINDTNSTYIVAHIDWVSTDKSGDIRSSNWSKTDGSSICPLGFRVPTLAEFKAELFDFKTLKIENTEDAFNSFLRLSSTGLRLDSTGDMRHVGIVGYYRTLSAHSLEVNAIFFGEDGVGIGKNKLRSVGEPIRCINVNF